MNVNCISTIQIKSYITALVRFFAAQNRDGSWGKSFSEKITLTAQAIQLMRSLNIVSSDKMYCKAVRWLEDNVSLGDEHWCTRLEIALKIGEFDKLINDGLIQSFITDLNYDLSHENEDDRIDLFWHVLPTLIALIPYESRLDFTIPHKEVVAKIKKFCYNFRDDCIVVKHHPNHTGLVAYYFSMLGENQEFSECKQLANAMTNWLIETRTESYDKGTYWLESKSITSYVIIDLLYCLPINEIEEYLPNIIKFLCPSKNGIIKGDKNTTYNTKLHSKSLYASVIVLRAISTIIGTLQNTSLQEIVNQINSNKSKFLIYKILNFLGKCKTKIPMIICGLITISGIVLYCFKLNDYASLCLSIGVAGALGLFFDWLRKNKE